MSNLNIRSIDAPYGQGETVEIVFDSNNSHLFTLVNAGDVTFKLIGMPFHSFTEQGFRFIPKQFIHGKITYTYNAKKDEDPFFDINYYGEIYVQRLRESFDYATAKNPVRGVILHNDRGPAFVEVATFQENKTMTYVEYWMQEGKLHRLYGPACTTYSSVNAPFVEFWEDDVCKHTFQVES
jgi:hypothetical protein